jgi:hypothetical protein
LDSHTVSSVATNRPGCARLLPRQGALYSTTGHRALLGSCPRSAAAGKHLVPWSSPNWRLGPKSFVRRKLPPSTEGLDSAVGERPLRGPNRSIGDVRCCVRCRGRSGKHLLRQSITGFDPTRTRNPRWPMSVRRSGLSADSVRWSGNDRFRQASP